MEGNRVNKLAMLAFNKKVGGGGAFSWNNLKDKPFGEEVTEGVLTFDGDLTGREYVQLDDETISIKMTDSFTPAEQFEGAIVTWFDDENGYQKSVVSNILSAPLPDSNTKMFIVYVEGLENIGSIVSVLGDLSEIGMPLTTGTYFNLDPRYNRYTASVSCLTGEVEIVQRLDEKYLPLLIAPNGKKFKLIVEDDGYVSTKEVL